MAVFTEQQLKRAVVPIMAIAIDADRVSEVGLIQSDEQAVPARSQVDAFHNQPSLCRAGPRSRDGRRPVNEHGRGVIGGKKR